MPNTLNLSESKYLKLLKESKDEKGRSKLVENYLDHIDKQHNLNEGLLSVMNHVFLFIGFGSPSDRRFKAIVAAARNCMGACSAAYPDEYSSTTSHGTQGRTDQDVQREKQETIETIKKNPERGKCMIMCYHDELKAMISLIKKDRKNICNKNINKDLCNKWIGKHLPSMEANVKALNNAIKLMGGNKEKPKNVNVVINKLKKIL